MLQGEFDFEDKLYNQLQTGDASGTINATLSSSHLSANDEVLIFWSGQILFSILGCVLSLVLIDVFLGYTVSDITVEEIYFDCHIKNYANPSIP